MVSRPREESCDRDSKGCSFSSKADGAFASHSPSSPSSSSPAPARRGDVEAQAYQRARRAFAYAHEIWLQIRPDEAGPDLDAMLDSVEHGFGDEFGDGHHGGGSSAATRAAVLDLMRPDGGRAGRALRERDEARRRRRRQLLQEQEQQRNRHVTFDDAVRECA